MARYIAASLLALLGQVYAWLAYDMCAAVLFGYGMAVILVLLPPKT